MIGTLLVSAVLASLAVKGNAAAPQPAAPPHKVGQIDRSHASEPAPPIAFETQAGKVTGVAAFRGKPVLVNLWATWCVPCRVEMPALNDLAKARAGKLVVLPVSEDLEGWRAVAKYFTTARFPSLTPYLDQPGNYAVKLGVGGLPVSILYGADGREKWRVNGPLKWGSAEVAAAFK